MLPVLGSGNSNLDVNDETGTMKFSMSSKIYLMIGLALLLVKCASKEDQDKGSENSRYLTLPAMEFQLKKTYESYEKTLREEHHIQNQNTIDETIQIMIDEGNIQKPYIIKRVKGVPEMVYVNYRQYKKYRITHPIDTTKVFTLPMDSIAKGR